MWPDAASAGKDPARENAERPGNTVPLDKPEEEREQGLFSDAGRERFKGL